MTTTVKDVSVTSAAAKATAATGLWRKEDPRLLTGAGRFIADFKVPGMVHAAFLRSPYAHARIRAIDTGSALAAPGVIAVYTGADLYRLYPQLQTSGVIPSLPSQEVYFVGQAVAMVVANDRYLAEDALEQIEVEYEPLPVVSDVEQAVAPDAPLVDTQRNANIGNRMRIEKGDIEQAFASAAVVLKKRFRVHRASGHPLETRGLVASPDLGSGGLLVWSATQMPHAMRDDIARGLALPRAQIRVLTPDVGGGFGMKTRAYPEDLCVAWAALALQRPVKWIEDRREHFAAVAHERAQVHEVEIAAAADGTILGLRDRILFDQGSHVLRGTVVASNSIHYLPGPYRVPAYHAELLLVFTNKISTGPYRGAGWPTVNFVMERLLDLVADTLGLDRFEIRRRNLIRPEEFPYHTGIPLDNGREIVYDSGCFHDCLDAVAQLARDHGVPLRGGTPLPNGRLRGIGLACALKGCGTYHETAVIKVDLEGRLRVYSGVPAQGQSHETTFAQYCAQILGVSPEMVSVIATDTEMVSSAAGTNASRSAPVGVPALAEAARRLKSQILGAAAALWKVSAAEVELAGGTLTGPGGQSMGLAELAAALDNAAKTELLPAGIEPHLEASAFFAPEQKTFSFAAYLAEVEVDPAAGAVQVKRLLAAYDCGRIIHPLVVEGQIQGGISYGVSMALFEEVVYAEDGQLLTTTFADYLLPTTDTMPQLGTVRLETPSGRNPEGLKGAGELGSIGPASAIAAAVENALQAVAPIQFCELPLSPERIFRQLYAR